MTGASLDPANARQAAQPPAANGFSPSPVATDTALVVASFVLEVVGTVGRAVNESGEFSLSMLADVPAATYVLLAVSSIALLWRRSHPLTVLGATLAASVVWDVIGLADGPSLAIFVSLYGVGRYVETDRTSVAGVVASLFVVVIDDLLVESEPASVVALSMGLVFAAWYAGRRVSDRRAYLALLEERAELRERERAATAQRAVAEERTRIARELHDVVAHRVSLITVQAGAAQTIATKDPEGATRAMAAVEDAARAALGELRQVLGVLRADDGDPALGPAHGLAEIPQLIADLRAAGVEVSLSTEGVPDTLPSGVDLASYRIVQEALTNVLKHGGPSPTAEVRVSAGDGLLTLEVIDHGSGVSTVPGSGQGIVGMRERATRLGGTFDAGPRADGGFRVTAQLPLQGGAQ